MEILISIYLVGFIIVYLLSYFNLRFDTIESKSVDEELFPLALFLVSIFWFIALPVCLLIHGLERAQQRGKRL